MIDIENAKIEFENYVSLFNPNDAKIKLKIEHIKRVSELSKEIAKSLNLNEEQIRLAEVIGLFHDIGRFKQVEKYNTFRDRDSENHAVLAIQVLFEENLIEKFKIEEKYYRIINKAVINHNKDKIEPNLSEEEMLFAKIIRDADKLDIYYVLDNYDFKDVFWYSNYDCKRIGKYMMSKFINDHKIDFAEIKSSADQIAAFFSFVYDMNFEFSKKYIIDKKYLEKYTEKVTRIFTSEEVKKQTQQLYEISIKVLKGE